MRAAQCVVYSVTFNTASPVAGQLECYFSAVTKGCESIVYSACFIFLFVQQALPEEVLEKYEERVQEESIAMAQMQGLVA